MNKKESKKKIKFTVDDSSSVQRTVQQSVPSMPVNQMPQIVPGQNQYNNYPPQNPNAQGISVDPYYLLSLLTQQLNPLQSNFQHPGLNHPFAPQTAPNPLHGYMASSQRTSTVTSTTQSAPALSYPLASNYPFPSHTGQQYVPATSNHHALMSDTHFPQQQSLSNVSLSPITPNTSAQKSTQEVVSQIDMTKKRFRKPVVIVNEDDEDELPLAKRTKSTRKAAESAKRSIASGAQSDDVDGEIFDDRESDDEYQSEEMEQIEEDSQDDPQLHSRDTSLTQEMIREYIKSGELVYVIPDRSTHPSTNWDNNLRMLAWKDDESLLENTFICKNDGCGRIWQQKNPKHGTKNISDHIKQCSELKGSFTIKISRADLAAALEHASKIGAKQGPLQKGDILTILPRKILNKRVIQWTNDVLEKMAAIAGPSTSSSNATINLVDPKVATLIQDARKNNFVRIPHEMSSTNGKTVADGTKNPSLENANTDDILDADVEMNSSTTTKEVAESTSASHSQVQDNDDLDQDMAAVFSGNDETKDVSLGNGSLASENVVKNDGENNGPEKVKDALDEQDQHQAKKKQRKSRKLKSMDKNLSDQFEKISEKLQNMTLPGSGASDSAVVPKDDQTDSTVNENELASTNSEINLLPSPTLQPIQNIQTSTGNVTITSSKSCEMITNTQVSHHDGTNITMDEGSENNPSLESVSTIGSLSEDVQMKSNAVAESTNASQIEIQNNYAENNEKDVLPISVNDSTITVANSMLDSIVSAVVADNKAMNTDTPFEDQPSILTANATTTLNHSREMILIADQELNGETNGKTVADGTKNPSLENANTDDIMDADVEMNSSTTTKEVAESTSASHIQVQDNDVMDVEAAEVVSLTNDAQNFKAGSNSKPTKTKRTPKELKKSFKRVIFSKVKANRQRKLILMRNYLNPKAMLSTTTDHDRSDTSTNENTMSPTNAEINPSAIDTSDSASNQTPNSIQQPFIFTANTTVTSSNSREMMIPISPDQKISDETKDSGNSSSLEDNGQSTRNGQSSTSTSTANDTVTSISTPPGSNLPKDVMEHQ